ncbi:ammonium transporter [Cytophagaceae bacterium ABcell3]|nr:ammonium transporter [Cytophagaceae bacterium ABcell3]
MEPTTVSNELFTVNNLWLMIATALVFIMHLGFATVESGLSRAKNTVNILFKNSIIPGLGLLTYAMWGFSIMYPGEAFEGSFFGWAGWGVSSPEGAAGLIAYEDGQYTYWTDFLFQAMFAATAATIVSGAVAERIKLESFLLFSLILVGLMYPIVGMWKWGGGFLETLETPFIDFAGSTIVHSVGGWAALAGAIVLGPRIGKYLNGKVRPLPGHSMPLATMGVFFLWLGWFGFNGGSVLSADPGEVSLVLVTTSLAAAAGAFGAMITSFIITKTHDLTMVLNGILGGLVGITAGADLMTPLDAAIIGLVCGMIVVFSVLFFDKIKVDDPVGAISVHLVCGMFGTLAVGIFGSEAGGAQLISQLIGIAATGIFIFPVSLGLLFLIDKTLGLRVSSKEEIEGLDLGEHGMRAYNIDYEKA